MIHGVFTLWASVLAVCWKWARRYCQCLMPSWVYEFTDGKYVIYSVRGGLIAELVSGPTRPTREVQVTRRMGYKLELSVLGQPLSLGGAALLDSHRR